jgi:hypothetical protein
MKPQYFYIALFMIISAASYAQDDINTSPDQAEAPATLPIGHFQMENRFRYMALDDDDSRELSVPETDFRFGLTHMIELHITAEFADVRLPDSTASGFKPVIAGIKARIWHERPLLPEISITARVQIADLASSDFKAEELAPEIGLLFRNTLGKNLELDYNFVAKWDGETASPGYKYAVSPEFRFAKDQWKIFAEAYGYLYEHESPEHWLDGGIMYVLRKNMQFELAAGYALTSQEGFHRYFGLAGFSFRI